MSNCGQITRRKVRRIIVRRFKDGSPYEHKQLRELACQISSDLMAHPSCVKKIEEMILACFKHGSLVHIDGVLRPRKVGDPHQEHVALRPVRQKQRSIERRPIIKISAMTPLLAASLDDDVDPAEAHRRKAWPEAFAATA